LAGPLNDHGRVTGVLFVEIVEVRSPSPYELVDVQEEFSVSLWLDNYGQNIGLGIVIRLEHIFVAANRAHAGHDLEPRIEEMPLKRPKDGLPKLSRDRA
jgi:hypothetical protein